jgi:molybdate transport system substrate-binding protein
MRKLAWLSALGVMLSSVAHAQPPEINVLSPGVVYNAGLIDLAQAYGKKTGIKVTVKSDGMGKIVADIKSATPPADVIVLPIAFMDGMEAEGNIVADSRIDLGRVNVGLAVSKGGPHPDISTPAKLAAVLKSGGTILYSDPANGSMEARVINDMLHRYPEFRGVKTKISTKGEGGEALVRGEGQMALQLICEIVNHPELELVGTLPKELGAYIDASVAVSNRSIAPDQAKAFVTFLSRPENESVWRSKGMIRQ